MIGWTQDPGRNGARTWLRLIYQAAAVGMREPRFTPPAADGIVEGWRHLLPRAQMFYVAPAASTLVHHAATSLTGYKLHPDDQPSDHGQLLFAEPLRDEAFSDDSDGRPITMVTWALRRNTVLLEFWCPNSYVERSEQLGYTVPGMARVLADHGGKLPANQVPGQVYPRHGYLYQRIAPLVLHGAVDHDYLARPWHDPDADDDTEDVETLGPEDSGKPQRVYTNPHGEGSAATIELQKLVAATFLVMGQTIIAETRIPTTPAEQTAARRRDETDPEVLAKAVVSLARRAPSHLDRPTPRRTRRRPADRWRPRQRPAPVIAPGARGGRPPGPIHNRISTTRRCAMANSSQHDAATTTQLQPPTEPATENVMLRPLRRQGADGADSAQYAEVRVDADGLEAEDDECQPPSAYNAHTGKLYLVSRKCHDCVFAPRGQCLDLGAGRLKTLTDGLRGRDDFLLCHNTYAPLEPTAAQPAICRGFFDAHGTETTAIRLARLLGLMVEIDPPAAGNTSHTNDGEKNDR
ncbi:MAG: hypothetical protein ACJ786_17935 [Catenulispora sp.]